MSELVNVKAENFNNEVKSLNQKEKMEEVRMTSAEVKMQAVEEARQKLAKPRACLKLTMMQKPILRNRQRLISKRLKRHILTLLEMWKSQLHRWSFGK